MKQDEKVRFNLGCGDRKISGYVNVDVCGEPDVVCDLSVFPWPFADNSADEIFSSHFLEHVEDFDRTIWEIYRILKPGGLFHFKVPHFRNAFTPWHIHKWQFSVFTCERLCLSFPYLWKGRQLFSKESIRINFIFIPIVFLRKPLGWLANIYPMLWDWMGLPIDEIEFKGRRL